MIVKMKFLSITGPKTDIDRVVDEYLSKYEIQLENALSELKTVQNLKPYMEINPYKDSLTKANEFLNLLNLEDGFHPSGSMTLDTALETIQSLNQELSSLWEMEKNLEEERDALRASLEKIQPFRELPYNVSDILHFKFIRFRFGKISQEYYDKFQKYVYGDLDTIFYKCHATDDYVWGVYFVPQTLCDKIDAVYSSLHFERAFLPDEYEGTAEEAYQRLEQEIADTEQEAEQYRARIRAVLAKEKDNIMLAQDKLNALSSNFDVRKLAACTKEDQHVFYILCGWMSESDATCFEKEIENDENLYCFIEDNHNNIFSTPPTKLKNPRIFKPFEMFVRMYGLPAYNEMDPTIFVALTYTFIFGAMFGDVGQGLCLAAGGALLYRFKKLNLAAIISCAGIFSTLFGFMYGSVFGFEDMIEAVWLKPASSMTTLPFIGKLNTVFVVAVAFGMFIILLNIIFQIINAIRSRDNEKIFFDANGIAGLVFYAAVIAVIALFMTGNTLPGGIVLGIMFGIPLLLIALKEPLTHLVEKKSELIQGGKVLFVVQTFFEMFEVLLSYFSNTLSFLRIGAFAVSHAAMMEVVLMLAGAEAGNPNWAVVIIGNLVVCGMEGLIVGIQVLRLEYYEMFSRFYKGTGREFKPYAKVRTKNN